MAKKEGTAEELSAQLEAKEKELAEAKEKIEKAESQVQGVEKLVAKWGAEMGDQRKQVEEALGKVKSSETEKKLQETLDRLAKIEEDVKSKSGKGTKTETVDVEKLKSSLSPEQKAKTEEVWKTLNPEQREAVYRNPEEMVKFLKAASEIPNSVPDSLFGEGAGRDDNVYRKLFGLDRQENFVPGSRRSGAVGFAGADAGKRDESSADRRLPGGVIPRPKLSEST